jgi:hypothetical protein
MRSVKLFGAQRFWTFAFFAYTSMLRRPIPNLAVLCLMMMLR